MSLGQSPVDYERVAGHYHEGRQLSVETLEQWRRAVLPYLPEGGPRRVIDVGAGTGLFMAVWKTWGASDVVAVEPSPGMRNMALRAGVLGRFVAGRAEQLPIRDRCTDVVWMSTVFHQLADRLASAAEVARILRTDGRWLIRGFFRDRSEIGWLGRFPGADRAVAAFPSSNEAIEVANDVGLVLLGAKEVPSERDRTLGHAAAWIRSMRTADTMLCTLTDDDVEEGLASLESNAAAPCPPNRLSLLAFATA
jgi:SAM-dependent methyltransferase